MSPVRSRSPAPVFSAGLLRFASDDLEQQQHNHNRENQTDTAAWVVAPAAAIRPRGESSDQHEDQDDEQNGDHRRGLLGAGISAHFLAPGASDWMRPARRQDARNLLRR